MNYTVPRAAQSARAVELLNRQQCINSTTILVMK
jgi:hypothetical protein